MIPIGSSESGRPLLLAYNRVASKTARAGGQKWPPVSFMFASDFISKLKKIDRKFNLDFDHRTDIGDGASGLYYDGEYVCGCPHGSMPERSLISEGRIIVRGWKDVLDILLNKKLITNDKSFKYFGYYK